MIVPIVSMFNFDFGISCPIFYRLYIRDDKGKIIYKNIYFGPKNYKKKKKKKERDI
jgi:hypothetical protein